MKSITLLSLVAGVCNAFVHHQLTSRPIHASRIFMSEPSDTSSDWGENDILTVESEAYEPTDAEALVTNVLDLMPDTLGEVSESTRATINEVLLKLEALNPTKQPTMSALLNGVWDLVC